MAAEQTRGKHYFIFTNQPLDDLLKKHAEQVSKHLDYERGPYYYVVLKRKMTIQKLNSIIGDETIVVEPQKNVFEILRCEVAKAKQEYDEMLKRGQMIVEVLNEDNTSEEVLNTADRRAVKAYRRSI